MVQRLQGSLLVISLVLIVILNITITQIRVRHGSEIRDPKYINEDFSPELPTKLRQVALNFTKTESYGLYDKEEWRSTIPHEGWVQLGSGPDRRPFAVTMYHQLHCLDELRKAISTTWPCDVKDIPPSVHRSFSECFHYLYETILCKSDITLERSHKYRGPDGEEGEVATGTNVLHRCQDWTQVRDFVERNYEENESSL